MRLYKYCPWKANKHIVNDLKNSILFFQKPALLNDPFDVFPSPDNLTDSASAILIQNIRNNIGLCSFTTDPKNLVMWAHYADKHRGICLCFDFPDNKSIITPSPKWNDRQRKANTAVRPLRVTYVKSRTKMNDLCGNNFINFFLTKYQAWHYEKEYRAFILEDFGEFNYSPQYLTGIIAGCKMPEKERLELRNTAKQLASPVRLFLTVPEHSAFRLDIKAIDKNETAANLMQQFHPC